MNIQCLHLPPNQKTSILIYLKFLVCVMMIASMLVSNLTARPNTVKIGIGRTILTKQTESFHQLQYPESTEASINVAI